MRCGHRIVPLGVFSLACATQSHDRFESVFRVSSLPLSKLMLVWFARLLYVSFRDSFSSIRTL